MRTDKVDNIFGASSFTLIVSFVCLTLLGLALIPQLTVKLVPSQDMPGLSVSYSVRDASSRMVESEVTSKLEGALARVGGVKGISSSSNNGNGSIRLSFDRHTCRPLRGVDHHPSSMARTARRGQLPADKHESLGVGR